MIISLRNEKEKGLSTDTIYFNRTKTTRFELSEKTISSGGEGSVYDIVGSSDKVAKIYHESRRTESREKKIEARVKIPASDLPECAWPQEMLFQEERFCGFVMDKVSGIGNLVDFFVYENRKNYTWQQYVIAAINIAAAVNNIHDAGIVIGDLKPDNIIIDPKSGRVKLVDTDSYQIIGADGVLYPCTVATPEYIPPELQNVNFEKNGNESCFSEKTDDFSLAVIIFKTLMNGVHPFSCFSAKRSLNNLEANIKNGCSPYFSETNPENDIQVTLRSPEIKVLPPEIQELFGRAFAEGRDHPEKRPSAAEWFYALSDLDRHLAACHRNLSHFYSGHLSSCPWCSLENEMSERKARFAELLNVRENEWRPKKPAPTASTAAPPPVPKKQTVSTYTDHKNDDDKNNLKAAGIAFLIILIFIFIVACLEIDYNYYVYSFDEQVSVADAQEQPCEIAIHQELGDEDYEM